MVKKKVNKFVYWTPRILSILFILFLALFSLDVFGTQLGFWGTVLALLIHNIPSLILLIVLVISWKKYDIVGGVAFILAGVVYSLLAKNLLGFLIISGPAFLIGILFLINWFKKK